jgi:hypothetical protein
VCFVIFAICRKYVLGKISGAQSRRKMPTPIDVEAVTPKADKCEAAVGSMSVTMSGISDGAKGAMNFRHRPSVATWLMPRPALLKLPSSCAAPEPMENAECSDAECKKTTVAQLRSLLQRYGLEKSGRKAALVLRWQEFLARDDTKLLQRCEQLLPKMVAAVDITKVSYRELAADLERELSLEPNSLQCIRPQLQAAVQGQVSLLSGPDSPAWSCSSVAGRRSANLSAQYYTWEDLGKKRVEGPEERASLAAQIERLSDLKRKMRENDQRLPEAKRLLLVMKVVDGGVPIDPKSQVGQEYEIYICKYMMGNMERICNMGIK